MVTFATTRRRCSFAFCVMCLVMLPCFSEAALFVNNLLFNPGAENGSCTAQAPNGANSLKSTVYQWTNANASQLNWDCGCVNGTLFDDCMIPRSGTKLFYMFQVNSNSNARGLYQGIKELC